MVSIAVFTESSAGVQSIASKSDIIQAHDTLKGGLAGVFGALQVKENSGIPVWVQIRNNILFQIKSGHIKQGDVLPTVRELATQLGVNYNTIHKVYQDLEADNLICSSRGKRSFVAEVDTNALQLPDSPVDLVIDELIRVATQSNVTKEDVMMRLDKRFAESES